MPADIERILKDNDYLSSQNSGWLSYWQDLATFCWPRNAWLDNPRRTGDRLKFTHLYSSEGIRDLKIMAAGFHSNITNAATKWFGMQTRDIDLMDSYNVRKWFSDTLNKMYAVINSTNLDTTLQEFYMSYGGLGTGLILVQRDYQTKVRYTLIPINQVNLVEDAQERIIQVYRNFKFTAQQAYESWGKKAGKSVLDVLDKKPYTELEFLHFVGPRNIRDYEKEDALNMEFESVWINKKDRIKMAESGFKEMPYIVGRFWKDSTDVLGFCPAMDVFADVKLLNGQTRTAYRRAMKETDPALSVPYRGYIAQINLNPSAINYRKAGIEKDAIQAIGAGVGNFQITKDMMDMTIKAIQDGFYVPLFQSLGNLTKQMTIPEVQQRIAESMALLGPAVGRHTYETLNPLLSRTLNTLYEIGEIPPIPLELEGQEVDFVFYGPLVKAQKNSEIAPIANFLQIIGGIQSQYPESRIADNIETDKIPLILQKILVVDPELIRDKKEVDAIRQAKAQAAQEANQLAQMSIGAEAAAKGAQAHKMMQEAEVRK